MGQYAQLVHSGAQARLIAVARGLVSIRGASVAVLSAFRAVNADAHGHGAPMAFAMVESLRVNRRRLAGMGSNSWWV
jgi:hypothetical protein